VDRHHILPRAHFAERQRPKADCIANIAFVTGGANRAVGANAPEVYLPKLDPGVLATQCIPADPKLWRIERAKDFWAARKDLLAQAFNEHLCSTLPNRRVQGARPE